MLRTLDTMPFFLIIPYMGATSPETMGPKIMESTTAFRAMEYSVLPMAPTVMAVWSTMKAISDMGVMVRNAARGMTFR